MTVSFSVGCHNLVLKTYYVTLVNKIFYIGDKAYLIVDVNHGKSQRALVSL